ncbi:MAG: hypothetical protein LUC94_05115 [Clostridiales bacterium]|nr:hypothetical protein [Clostridiales bacterium]
MDKRTLLLNVPAAPFRNLNLSLRAVGMLVRMYALEDKDGGMTDYELCAACHLDIESVYEVAGELTRAGYLADQDSRFVLRKETEVEDGWKQAV